jgi:hypothetical protein
LRKIEARPEIDVDIGLACGGFGAFRPRLAVRGFFHFGGLKQLPQT